MKLPKDMEHEERSKLINRIQVLERELRSRQAFREADKREVDEIAADEVLEHLETSLKNRATEWDSDSDHEDEIVEVGEHGEHTVKQKEQKPILSVIRYARDQINALSTLTILIKNDSEFGEHHHLLTNDDHRSGGERNREILVDTVQGMSFRSLLELVCEYWGINLESTAYRLVDERGTWHKLSMTVHSAIRPSRREHPVLFLQKRKNLEEVMRKCEYGIVEDFGFDYSNTSLKIAPVVAMPDHLEEKQLQQQQPLETDNLSVPTRIVGKGVLTITNASRGIWKKDVILFTWRRVACDFLFTTTLFVIICVYLALAPRYTEARGVSLMITNSLINANFISPSLSENVSYVGERRLRSSPREVTDWTDFWSWIQGPVSSVIQSNFFPDRQSVLFGPVRFRQNRVRNVTCSRPDLPSLQKCFPTYSSRFAQNTSVFAGTPYVKGVVPRITGVFGDYESNAYVIDVHPNASADSSNCTTLMDETNQVAICGSGSNAVGSCWDCVINGLQNNSWADDGSRLITVQFLVYSGNANIFIDTQFAFELSITGYVLMSYEIPFLSVQRNSSTTTAFVAIVSVLISFIGIQFFQGAAYIRRVYQEAKAMDAHGVVAQAPVSFVMRICWSLPTRFTVWNPIIFVLCIVGLVYANEQVAAPTIPPGASLNQLPFQSILAVGNFQIGEVLLGVANMALAYKLSTYFEFTSRFLTYFLLVAENLAMLCAVMTVTVCSFAWLLTVSASASNLRISTSFGESFVFIVRLLLNQVKPEEFYALGADIWFPLSWIFYASQIVLNLLLVRIAAPICYEALKREESAADYVIESLRKANKAIQHWVAT